MDGFDEGFLLQAAYRSDVALPWTTAGDDGLGPGRIDLVAHTGRWSAAGPSR